MNAPSQARPASIPPAQPMHTISLFVNNKPGVLVRVALVFSRRGYNIESLVVNHARQDDYARMTITCSGDRETFQQIIKQLAKLVDVVRAEDHTHQNMVESEVALIKVAAPLDKRTELLQITEHYKAKVVDYGEESLMLRVHGCSAKLDTLLMLLSRFEVRELVRSGKIVMARGTVAT